MSISSRNLLIEVSIASALVLLVALIASPEDLGLPALGIHLAWLPITLFAARYGVVGLASSIIAITVPLGLAAYAMNGSVATLTARVHTPSDVFAMLIAVGAAWIGMSQAERVRRLSRNVERHRAVRERAEAAGDELTDAVEVLRARCDRMDTSLTVWRSLAQRMERGAPAEAARAALELCSLRCPSSAALVQCLPAPDREQIIARRGPWRFEAPRPQSLANDLTVQAALQQARVVCAEDVDGASEADSDLAVPVLDESDGSPLGVIALRGVDPRHLRAAELRDLRLIAAWLSAPMARALAKPRLRAVHEETYK